MSIQFGDTRLPERFWDKVEPCPVSGCWVWAGGSNNCGYGQFGWDGGVRLVHRVSYQLLVGTIPDGLVCDHLCRVRACVNPSHIEPVTQRENIRRGETGKYRRAATPCEHGDEHLARSGRKVCRACERARDEARQNRLRPNRVRRPRSADPTKCSNGHSFSSENTYMHPRGQRRCRTCEKERRRARYDRLKREAVSSTRHDF